MSVWTNTMISLWSYLLLVSIYSISLIDCSSFSFFLSKLSIHRSLFSCRPESTTFLAESERVHIPGNSPKQEPGAYHIRWVGSTHSCLLLWLVSPAWTTISPLSPICSLSYIQAVTAWSSMVIYQTYVGVPLLVSSHPFTWSLSLSSPYVTGMKREEASVL